MTAPAEALRHGNAGPSAVAEVALAVVRLARYGDSRPTVDELAAATGRSRRTVHDALHGLRGAGVVTFEDRKSRTLLPAVREVRP